MNKILALFLIIGILFFGCIGQPSFTQNISTGQGQDVTSETDINQGQDTTQQQNDTTTQNTSQTQGTTGSTGKKTALLLGRSVTGNWANYLGLEYTCQDEQCSSSTYEGDYSKYHFIYQELSSPPDIVDSAISALDTYGDKSDYVFFKLCFVDFESDTSGANLKANEGYVEKVYDEIVVKRKKILIVGNALPKVKGETDSALVANHKAYNAWLNNFASTHSNIKVLDLYGTVSDTDGSLKSSYAIDSEDSHLNNAAYAQITPKFLSLLES